MTNTQDKYFIKKGYTPNDNARTFEFSEEGSYWTQERIRTASHFQYNVYLLGARIAKKHHLKVGLDLGCGPATKTNAILAPVLERLYLVDQPNIESLASKTIPSARFFGVNLEDFQLKIDEKIELIMCADVLEHLSNPLPSLEFAFNHLASSGFAIFSTPERDILRGKDCMTSPHQAHVREWNRTEFRQLLEFSGFNVIKHILLPPKHLPWIEEWARISCFGLIESKRWASCQVAICCK